MFKYTKHKLKFNHIDIIMKYRNNGVHYICLL